MSTAVDTRPAIPAGATQQAGPLASLRSSNSAPAEHDGYHLTDEDEKEFMEMYRSPGVTAGSLSDEGIPNHDVRTFKFRCFARLSQKFGEEQKKRVEKVLLNEARSNEPHPIPQPVIREVEAFFGNNANELTDKYYEMIDGEWREKMDRLPADLDTGDSSNFHNDDLNGPQPDAESESMTVDRAPLFAQEISGTHEASELFEAMLTNVTSKEAADEFRRKIDQPIRDKQMQAGNTQDLSINIGVVRGYFMHVCNHLTEHKKLPEAGQFNLDMWMKTEILDKGYPAAWKEICIEVAQKTMQIHVMNGTIPFHPRQIAQASADHNTHVIGQSITANGPDPTMNREIAIQSARVLSQQISTPHPVTSDAAQPGMSGVVPSPAGRTVNTGTSDPLSMFTLVPSSDGTSLRVEKHSHTAMDGGVARQIHGWREMKVGRQVGRQLLIQMNPDSSSPVGICEMVAASKIGNRTTDDYQNSPDSFKVEIQKDLEALRRQQLSTFHFTVIAKQRRDPNREHHRDAHEILIGKFGQDGDVRCYNKSDFSRVFSKNEVDSTLRAIRKSAEQPPIPVSNEHSNLRSMDDGTRNVPPVQTADQANLYEGTSQSNRTPVDESMPAIFGRMTLAQKEEKRKELEAQLSLLTQG
ncbi:hypothetical protein LTR86_011249 [Recurvomyces mirabilis]|nr:hypothetical protein LTR86_011249 [Recurvomyces mirabilis]